jgi:hypothetical protein
MKVPWAEIIILCVTEINVNQKIILRAKKHPELK